MVGRLLLLDHLIGSSLINHMYHIFRIALAVKQLEGRIPAVVIPVAMGDGVMGVTSEHRSSVVVEWGGVAVLPISKSCKQIRKIVVKFRCYHLIL